MAYLLAHRKVLLLAHRKVLLLVRLGGPHVVSAGPLAVGSGIGAALVVYSGPLSPWEPWAVEDADVNLPPALHKASSNYKSGQS